MKSTYDEIVDFVINDMQLNVMASYSHFNGLNTAVGSIGFFNQLTIMAKWTSRKLRNG